MMTRSVCLIFGRNSSYTSFFFKNNGINRRIVAFLSCNVKENSLSKMLVYCVLGEGAVDIIRASEGLQSGKRQRHRPLQRIRFLRIRWRQLEWPGRKSPQKIVPSLALNCPLKLWCCCRLLLAWMACSLETRSCWCREPVWDPRTLLWWGSSCSAEQIFLTLTVFYCLF